MLFSKFKNKKVQVKESPIPPAKTVYLSEEHEYAVKAGLKVQAKIYEMEALGYKFITFKEIEDILGGPISRYYLYEFPVKIPFGVLLKVEEEKKKGIFDRFLIYTPFNFYKTDPLLIGQVKVVYKAGDYPKERELDFLLAQWV